MAMATMEYGERPSMWPEVWCIIMGAQVYRHRRLTTTRQLPLQEGAFTVTLRMGLPHMPQTGYVLPVFQEVKSILTTRRESGHLHPSEH